MSYRLPQRQLVQQSDAALVERPDIPRSTFRGRHERLMTFDAGKIYPFLCQEVLPGDHMTYEIHAYVRMSTPLFPIFSNQRVDIHLFYVPNRILWSNWVRLMGEQILPGDPPPSNYSVPQVVSAAGGFPLHSIYDHMGLPTAGQTTGGQTISVNALPFRAYQKIYYDWFRDQNLTNIGPPPIGNGPDAVGVYAIHNRAKFHDYFTSALPWPQKFITPQIPLSGQAPISGIATNVGTHNPQAGTWNQTQPLPALVNPDAVLTNTAGYLFRGSGGNPEIYAELSQTQATFTINTLRNAFAIQTMLERDARGGTRYTESILMHFGVRSPDARLQRSEYIGGGSAPLSVTPVAQTAPTVGQTVGTLGAAATSVGQSRASYAATEHGYILGLISVRTELAYNQGIPRLFSRLAREDFYLPALAGLGEQAILRKELYSTGITADDNMVFGYQERWHEYRASQSEVTGQFRTYIGASLAPWHLVQNFGVTPVLGNTFITDSPPMSRILAGDTATTNQQYLADILINRTAVRPIPTYGTPTSLTRF